MLIRKCITLVIVIFFVIIPCISDAGNLRGRVDGRNQYSDAPYPIGGAAVVLFIKGPGDWQPVAKCITGLDGMYFFQNILPGPYALQINGRQNYPITVLNQPDQDLPPIVIQY
ncbi:MAG: hypothetical protein V1844_04230 [Pseudomonadota bacterium]